MIKAQSQPITTDFENFRAAFPYRGRAIYQTLFERNKDRITTNKAKFAVVNLEKIFTATFELTSRIGFPVMSLRDLSRATGLSMGGIYSYIESKERIAIMVKDLVKQVSEELLARSLSDLSDRSQPSGRARTDFSDFEARSGDYAMRNQGNRDRYPTGAADQPQARQAPGAEGLSDPMAALETLIREHVFASEILRDWFSFLYFETRSLPHAHQEESKNIELRLAAALHELIDQVRRARHLAHGNSPIVATTLIALIQDRYLKPWKHGKSGESADAYAQQVLALMHCAIEHP